MSTISQRHADGSTSDGRQSQANDLIVLTPYPVEPGHTLITILRINSSQWRPEMNANVSFRAEGANAGIIINKAASIMDFNRTQAAQNERMQPPSAKLSFKVSMINSETERSSLEHRTLRFWLICNNNDNTQDKNVDDALNSSATPHPVNNSHANQLKQQSSQLAQNYFRELIGTKPDDDFPKSYVNFIMKLMRLLKQSQFKDVARMEIELRQLDYEDNPKSLTRTEAGPVTNDPVTLGQAAHQQTGRRSPLTSQKVLDIIESSYPNPISVHEICSSTQSNEQQVRRFLDELALEEKISASGKENQLYTRTTKATSDTKIQLVKQMPKFLKIKQPVIAIITSQYREKLAVDAMISDKETYVRYRTTYGGSSDSGSTQTDSSSANYVYTLGNIGDHRVVSTKLTSIGHSRKDLIAAGNATTRLLGTFPDIEFVFLVGCGGGVPNYTDFESHVRLGDVVVSHLPTFSDLTTSDSKFQDDDADNTRVRGSKAKSPSDFVYVHCRPKVQSAGADRNRKPSSAGSTIPVSFSIHNNLKKFANSNNGDNPVGSSSSSSSSLSPTSQIKDARWFEQQQQQEPNNELNQELESITNKPFEYDDCHFRLWRPARLDLQELSTFIWAQGLEKQKHRIWEYYIEHGIKQLAQLDVDASRPKPDKDKLYMSIGLDDTIEVSHPEAADDEIDLRREGQPMCHFGPIGSGLPAASNESLRQRMIAEFGLRAFDLEFDPVVESIYGNCKESYIIIRGISDYQDGRKRKDWQQYSALVAAAFMKSIIVNLKPF